MVQNYLGYTASLNHDQELSDLLAKSRIDQFSELDNLINVGEPTGPDFQHALQWLFT